MVNQDNRYKKIKKVKDNNLPTKEKKPLTTGQKIGIIAVLFLLCLGAVIALVILLVQKYHS